VAVPAPLDARDNRLLCCLPEDEREQLLTRATPTSLGLRQRVYEAGDSMTHVFFPVAGLLSVIATSRGGATVEVGPVGCDGMVGLPVFLGGDSDPLEAFCQIAPVDGLRMPATAFRDCLTRLPGLDRVIRLYAQWTYYAMAQWVLCARVHPVEERLARWLMMCHDRVGADRFPLTHEFLSEMLGTRRASVTIAAGVLRAARIVDYERGMVTVLDRHGLAEASCECWRVTNIEYRRLLGIDPGFIKAGEVNSVQTGPK
jgi:CRP-like cAMP-binding protein